MKTKQEKTRPFKGKEDFKCPVHGCSVIHRARMHTDKETGKKSFGGEFFACPEYSECKYYINNNCTRVSDIDVQNIALKIAAEGITKVAKTMAERRNSRMKALRQEWYSRKD